MSKNNVEIAAYYFPNYHIDPENEAFHGKGWNEWKLLQSATPRFENHQQPKAPMWGYEDESDPVVMEKKIDAASDHGLHAFIFDWYWYSKGKTGSFIPGIHAGGFFYYTKVWWHRVGPCYFKTPG